MRGHPDFVDHACPERMRLGAFDLAKLGVAHLDEDYAAVTQSEAELVGLFDADAAWPVGLTLEENRIDLAWHQREFEARRSFAWVVSDADDARYLGCLYLFPRMGGRGAADLWHWFRTGETVDGRAFVAAVDDQLAGPDWPNVTYRWHTR